MTRRKALLKCNWQWSESCSSKVGTIFSTVTSVPAVTVLQLCHHRLPDLLGLAHLEVEEIEVGREDADVAFAEILDELGRLPQRREAEIGRGRSADRPAYGADALLDLILGVVLDGLGLAGDLALALGFRQVLVTPGMRADGVAARGHLLEDAAGAAAAAGKDAGPETEVF